MKFGLREEFSFFLVVGMHALSSSSDGTEVNRYLCSAEVEMQVERKREKEKEISDRNSSSRRRVPHDYASPYARNGADGGL